MRKVVVNTTPIVALAEIGKLSLLHQLYGKIIIPEAVLDEIKSEPAYTLVRENSGWIDVVSFSISSEIRKLFRSKLHAGEIEVISYAMKEKAELVIIDDMAARKMAKYMDLTVTGTMGVIIKAKQSGYIDNARYLIDALISNGLYISDELYEMVLRLSGESAL